MYTVTQLVAYFHRFGTVEKQKRKTVATKKAQGRALQLCQSNADCKLLCSIGIEKEQSGIERYCEMNNISVRYPDTLKKWIALDCYRISIAGRPDAIDTNNDLIVEHKYRTRAILGFVPFHELVQCYIYMQMFEKSGACLIETFGRKMQTHFIRFDTNYWKIISQELARNISKSDFVPLYLEKQTDERLPASEGRTGNTEKDCFW